MLANGKDLVSTDTNWLPLAPRRHSAPEPKRKEYPHVQVKVYIIDPARRSGRHRRNHRHRLAGRHGCRAGHLVRDLRVHRRGPAGHAGLQQPHRGTGVRASAAGADRPGGRCSRPGLAGPHRAGAGAGRGDLGVRGGLRRDLRRLWQRGDRRHPGDVYRDRADLDRVRGGARRPSRHRRGDPRAAVRPVQPDLRSVGDRHRCPDAPDREDLAFGPAGCRLNPSRDAGSSPETPAGRLPSGPLGPLGRRPQPQTRRPIPRTKGTTMTKPDLNPEPPGGAPAQPGTLAQVPHAAGAGGQAAKLKDMQTTLQDALRRHPVVLEQEAQRAQHVQLRIADWITGFAGSMNFVYIHIAIFTIWMLFIESKPWPTLTLIVSLEAIFLSTFVMIGQNRQAAFQQAKADHDFTEQELELKTNTQLTREIHTLTTELHNRLLERANGHRDGGARNV